MSGQKLFLVAGMLACALASGGAQAETGKASAAPGQWFFGFNVGGGPAWGPDHEAFAKGPRLATDLESQNFTDGAFFTGGLEAGYRFEPGSLLDRVELNVDLNMQSRDINRDPNNVMFSAVDRNGKRDAFGLGSFDYLHVDGDEDTAGMEARLSFKSMLSENEGHALLASLEPFFRYQDTDSDVTVKVGDSADDSREFAKRSDGIEAEYYGLQLALEMEAPLSQSLSLVGRASAGAYYVTSDIETETERLGKPALFPVADSASTWGGRFGGALGIKVPLFHSGASMTLMGTVDYMTDVATLDHVPQAFPTRLGVTRAGFDDQWELGGKAALVFPLQ